MNGSQKEKLPLSWLKARTRQLIYKKIFLIKNRPLSDLLIPQEETKVPIREVLREPKPKIIEPERKIIVETRPKEEPKKIEETKQVE